MNTLWHQQINNRCFCIFDYLRQPSWVGQAAVTQEHTFFLFCLKSNLCYPLPGEYQLIPNPVTHFSHKRPVSSGLCVTFTPLISVIKNVCMVSCLGATQPTGLLNVSYVLIYIGKYPISELVYKRKRQSKLSMLTISDLSLAGLIWTLCDADLILSLTSTERKSRLEYSFLHFFFLFLFLKFNYHNPTSEPRGSLFSWTKTSAGALWCKTFCGKQLESSTGCEMKQENWTPLALSYSSSRVPAGQTGGRQDTVIVWALQRRETGSHSICRFHVLHSAFIGLLKTNTA